MKKRTYINIGCLILAVMLHTVIYHLLYADRPRPHMQDGIRVKLVATEPPKLLTTKKNIATRANSSLHPSVRPLPLTTRERTFEAGKSGYQKLLPEEGRDFGIGSTIGSNERSLGYKLAPEEQGHLAIMASEMDVPLHWRRNAKASLATAHLVIRGDDHEVWCRLLNGEPILRAVLWTYLQKPKVYAALKELLKHADGKDYQIRLRFLPEDGPERALNFSEGSFAYSRGVEIVRTLPSLSRDFGGVAIENDDSRKAKLRDRLALSTLYESPAFTHQIREVKLGVF